MQTSMGQVRIATLNVENFQSNTMYVSQLLKSCDILCVQEHWLYNYQVGIMAESIDDIIVAAKCVDDDDNITPLQRPRGKGGVAILWKSRINHLVTVIDDGGDRVQAILLETDTQRLCIVCVYMPCRGKLHHAAEYSAVLDEVYEIKRKYHYCPFIWCGDMNASYIRKKKDPQDVKFMEFCKEIGVVVPPGMPRSSTYYHHNKRDEAQIDYIMIPDGLASAVVNVVVHSREAMNTSTHSPVCIVLALTMASRGAKQHDIVHSSCAYPPTINWKKLDTALYKEVLASKLEAVECILDDQTPVEVAISSFYDALTDAARKSAPLRRGKHGRKKIWSPELSSLAKQSKVAHKEWVRSGRPGKGDASHTAMKKAKNGLRRAQRALAADERSKVMSDIMTANNDDQALFYKLIRRQRGDSETPVEELIVEGELLEGQHITEGWARYFSKLATPMDNPNFDPQYKNDVELKVLLLHDLNASRGEPIPTFDEEDVRKAAVNLKAGKAMDELGLAAEHIRYGESQILPFLTNLVNRIVQSKKVPELFKSGLITPVYKKNKKPKSQPDSYRRITISSILGKILERLLEPIISGKFDNQQSRMQRGFTSGVSCTNAAWILSEAINESMDLKLPIWMAMFDASKAFDVVWQSSLLLKLHRAGITGDLWLLLEDWYRGQRSSVKWKGDRSTSFVEQQGVRQGGILSPVLYKIFVNSLLIDMEESGVGLHIGSVYAGIPTCADDVTVLASKPEELQTMITVAEDYASKEQYSFNTTKTKVLLKHGHKEAKHVLEQELSFQLYKEPLEVVKTQTHLGVDRFTDQTDSAIIPGRIKCARRTSYSLMSSGFHGLNGLGAASCSKLWNTYVVPRLLYGLEVLQLTKKDVATLEHYQTGVFKQIQHLPNRTSNAATLLLLGQQPVEAALDRRILTQFGSMIRTQSAERDIVIRQLAMKGPKSCSWVTNVSRILDKYNLPSPFIVAETQPTKTTWKRVVKAAIQAHWTRELKRKACSQSSLQFVNIDGCQIGVKHQVWSTVSAEPRDATRAAVKAKLLTGTYMLQSNKAKFNQYQIDETCPLCDDGMEDRKHFIVVCRCLQLTRDPYMSSLGEVMAKVDMASWQNIVNNSDLLLQFVLDCSDPCVMVQIKDASDYVGRVESITRRMCYALHCKRSAMLQQSTCSETSPEVAQDVEWK
jgi:endonuclease/exonuclease/phosphatase family metal-dependent hydrolase